LSSLFMDSIRNCLSRVHTDRSKLMNNTWKEVRQMFIENQKNTPVLEKKLNSYLRQGKKSGDLYLMAVANYYLAVLSYRAGHRVNMFTYAHRSVSFLDGTDDFNLKSFAYNILGLAYAAQENYQLALEAYDVVEQIVREHRKCMMARNIVLNNIGECYYQLADYEKCVKIFVKIFQEVLRKEPDNHESVTIYGTNLADCYCSLRVAQKADETLDYLESRIDHLSDYKPAITAIYASRALASFLKKDLKEAYRYSDLTITSWDESTDTYEVHNKFEKIAHILIKYGEIERAASYLEILSSYAEKTGHTLDRIIAERVHVDHAQAAGRTQEHLEACASLNALYVRRIKEEKEIQLAVRKRTEEKAKEVRKLLNIAKKNKEKAITDALTGFYNKAGTEEIMAGLCMEGGGGMLMVLDLDNFKLVNDIYGHDMGDKVLKCFADIARRRSRDGDVLCRIGGDEFLVYFRNTQEERAAAAFTERLNEQLLSECKELAGGEFAVPIGVSLGAVRVPEEGGSYQEFFSHADKALYQVKQSGKHGYRLYDATHYEDSLELDLEKELDQALKICEERGGARDAMWVGQEAFSWIYRFMDRFSQRYQNGYIWLMLSLTFSDGINSEEIAEAIYQFGTILQKSLRKSDVITQNKTNCFLILLPEFEKEQVRLIVERVQSEWKKTPYSGRIPVSFASKCADPQGED